MNRRGALKGGEIFFARLQRHHGVIGSCFEIGYVALQCSYRRLLLASLSLGSCGLVGSVSSCGLCLLEILLGLLPVLLILLQLLRELLDLLLLSGQGVFQRLDVGGTYCRLRGRLRCRGYVFVRLLRSW